MNVLFKSKIWHYKKSPALIDVNSDFAPVSKIHLWLRDEKTASLKGVSAVHEFYCLYLCLEGSGCIDIDGVPHFIEAGEVLGVLPRHPHQRLKSSGTVKYLLIRFQTREPEFVQRLFNGIVRFDDSLEPFIQNLVCAYELAVQGSNEQNHNEVGLYLALLLNRMTTCEQETVWEAVSNKRIHDALQLIISPENLDQSIRDIARKLGITPGHLSDLIHDNLGYPPRNLKRMVRHQVAVNYLLHSSLSISQTAEAAGFKSVYAFSRFFKNVTGMSPLAFRRLHEKAPSTD